MTGDLIEVTKMFAKVTLSSFYSPTHTPLSSPLWEWCEKIEPVEKKVCISIENNGTIENNGEKTVVFCLQSVTAMTLSRRVVLNGINQYIIYTYLCTYIIVSSVNSRMAAWIL